MKKAHAVYIRDKRLMLANRFEALPSLGGGSVFWRGIREADPLVDLWDQQLRRHSHTIVLEDEEDYALRAHGVMRHFEELWLAHLEGYANKDDHGSSV